MREKTFGALALAVQKINTLDETFTKKIMMTSQREQVRPLLVG